MKNEYTITKELMNSWAKEFYLYGAVNILLFALWCFVGIIGVFGLILSVLLKLDRMIIFIYSLILVMAIFRLFIRRFIIWSKRYKMTSLTYGVTEWLRTTEFTDDEITLTDHTFIMKLKYSNIRSIKEKGNAVMIFMNDNLGLRLYKDAFSEGSWEECKKLIFEKNPKTRVKE